MNGWMNRWMDGRMDGRTDVQTDGWVGGWMDGRTDGWVGGWVVDGWMDGQTGGWMDGWKDGPTDTGTYLALPAIASTLSGPLGPRKITERRPSSLSMSRQPALRPHLSVFSTNPVAGASQLSVVSKGMAFLLNSLLSVGKTSSELMLPTVLLEKFRPTPFEYV